jgi:tetratricopeptide (TPR) repeat protein
MTTLILICALAMQDDIDTARARLTAILKAKKATLGTVREAAAAAIDFGAKAWNAGDQQACADFYVETGEAVVKAVGGGPVGEIQKALKRAGESTDVARRAWAMRYGFDRVTLAWELKATELRATAKMAADCMARGQLDEAVDAATAATAALAEIEPQDPRVLDVNLRVAPLLLAHALFAQGRFAEAGKALRSAATRLPEGTKFTFVRRDMTPDKEGYDARLDELETQAAKQGADADLLFLLGYELHFSDRRDEAKEWFRKAVKRAPERAAGRWMIKGDEDY